MRSLLVSNLVDLGLCLAILTAAIAILHGVERAAAGYISRRWGWNAVLVTGWIGVPLHELSHLLMARLFGHRIVAWKIFDPDPSTGTLGYVWHAYRRRNLWQLAGNLFIGMAPLLSGVAVLLLCMAWMAPSVRGFVLPPVPSLPMPARLADWAHARVWLALAACVGHSLLIWTANIWRMRTLWLPVQVYLCIAVASHSAPSQRDLVSSFTGAMVVLAFAAVAVVALSIAGRTTANAALVAPIACLAVIVVCLFQGLYVLTVAAVSALTVGTRS